MTSIYNIDRLITHPDFRVDDRWEWVKWACCLKVLGYDFSTFFHTSNCSESECRKTWEKERNPHRYFDSEDKAVGMVISVARNAGIDVERYRKTPDTRSKNHNYPHCPQLPTLPTITHNHPTFVPTFEIFRMMKDAPESALWKFLCRFFPEEEVSRAFKFYQVGATREFGTIPMGTAFPYLNTQRDCVDVHLMAYEEDGHRKKEGYNQNWVIAKNAKAKGVEPSTLRGEWPLFGEHLLTSAPSAPVGVVESEKTALIAFLCCPQYIWVATASLANLNEKRCKAIKGREVFIFPDCDGIEQWREKAAKMAANGFRIHFAEDFIRTYVEGEKDDLGDILLRLRQKELGLH